MSDMIDDNRFVLIKKYKQKLIEGTNISDSPEDMAAINSILFRFWQMGWLDKLEKEPHWIPVTERLPEYGVDCLVTVKQKYTWQTDWEYFVDLGWRGDYIDGAWDTANDWDEGQETHISAWMPLPPVYQGE